MQNVSRQRRLRQTEAETEAETATETEAETEAGLTQTDT